MDFTAQPRPTMLIDKAIKKTTAGPGLVRPSDIPSALAQMASKTALSNRMIHGMSAHHLQTNHRGDQHQQEQHPAEGDLILPDRKSTRLNSSHVAISYAVFCLKKQTSRRAR